MRSTFLALLVLGPATSLSYAMGGSPQNPELAELYEEQRTHSSAEPVNSMERNRLWIEWVRKHLDAPAVF